MTLPHHQDGELPQQLVDFNERHIIEKLIQLRNYFGISLSQLADLLNITPSELYRYESFQAPIPASLLALTAAFLGVPFDYFYRSNTLLDYHMQPKSISPTEPLSC